MAHYDITHACGHDERIELFQFLRDGAAYRIECNHSSGDVL